MSVFHKIPIGAPSVFHKIPVGAKSKGSLGSVMGGEKAFYISAVL